MNPPLVSIIIDNFNYGRFLTQSIDSALAQTYPAIEVIVVDDVSTDDSRQIMARYADRIIPVYQPTNRGQGAAFNAGFEASHGEIVMFLDSDDWLFPHAVDRIMASWTAGLAKIHFRLDLVDVTGRKVDVHPAREVALDGGNVVPLLLDWGRYETVVTSGNALSRAALEKNLPIPESDFRIAADGYLATVVPFDGSVGVIEDCLGAYRVHGGNAYAYANLLGDALSSRTRKFLAHDAHKDRVLRAKAATAGLAIPGDPQLRDPAHLEMRLASIRLNPEDHPHAGDNRISLMLRGMAASRRARLPWPRRGLFALWFLVVGLAPRKIAISAIQWKFLPATRPSHIDRNLKRLRQLLR